MELRLRCLQIDLARQKERADFVKSYADLAAESGYNALILYLENAVRTEDTAFFDREDTYSAEEISEIVDYAESLGLDVIPAFENLGHLEKFFCYKELESFSEIEDAAFEGRGFDNYKRGACGCVTNPALRAFMDKYITDVCSLFRSKYVHMGLDEPFDLAVCGRCKAAAAEKGKSELFYEHIMHTYELCRNLGRTMMMWDDFFEYADLAERLPRDIILCNWNYVFVGDEPQGHWTNRIKKDWFRLYDELGFQYLFCTYAHRASSEYNVDTFTAYAEKYHPEAAAQVELAEYTINQTVEEILADLYERKPEAVAFSCYIWNWKMMQEVISELHQVRPELPIWLGGPEVSYHAEEVLEQFPFLTGIMVGEGEVTFSELLTFYEKKSSGRYSEQQQLQIVAFWPGAIKQAGLDSIAGIVYRDPITGELVRTKERSLTNISEIPFFYKDMKDFANRIVYYESSRGCPFRCGYCLSSIDKRVRLRDLALVKEELQFFLDQKVPQVKFIDRTFNCNHQHAMEIWSYIQEHDNGITNFHFEIAADLITEEELELLNTLRPGLVQLEIGVQSTNPQTIEAIHRKMDFGRVTEIVNRIAKGRNIHQHLDLIAGLPYEDIESFHRSFNDVYKMEPEQLQLGFLKVLKGSYMEEMKQKYGLLSQSKPPYEVLRTNWLSYEEVIRLKGVEEMVEVYYNSGQFRRTMKYLVQEWGDAFDLYDRLAAFYEEEGLNGVSHNRLARYEILYLFIQKWGNKEISYQDLLIYDLYLRENVKSRPSFAPDPSEWKNETKQFFMREAKERRYLKGYEAYDSRQMAKMAHLERMEDGSFVLFDYKNRDALFGNAAAFSISQDEIQ